MPSYRRILFEALGNKCEVTGCNRTDLCIHHKDGNEENNSLENLALLCRKHHKREHSQMLSGLPTFDSGFFRKGSDVVLEAIYRKKELRWKEWYSLSLYSKTQTTFSKIVKDFIDLGLVERVPHGKHHPTFRITRKGEELATKVK